MNAPESFPQFLARADGLRLAYRHRPGQGPTIIFLPGYMSDMEGSKAIALDAWAAEQGRAMLRLDYAGCGASEGRFEDGTLARWRDDALALIDGLTQGPLLLAGSSMGGWLALLIALARPVPVGAEEQQGRYQDTSAASACRRTSSAIGCSSAAGRSPTTL